MTDRPSLPRAEAFPPIPTLVDMYVDTPITRADSTISHEPTARPEVDITRVTDFGGIALKAATAESAVTASAEEPPEPSPDPSDSEPQTDEPTAGADAPEAPPPETGSGNSNTIDPPETPPPAASSVPSDDDPDKPDTIRVQLPMLKHQLTRAANASDNRAELYARKEKELMAVNVDFWTANDSPLDGIVEDTYADWFNDDPERGVIPPGETLKEHIETRLAPLEHRRGIDVGGIGSRLFRDFTPGFFDKTVGVTLTDPRQVSPYKRTMIGQDESRGHSVIEGNLMKPETFEAVDTWLNGEKAALIIERMYAGIKSLPEDPFAVGANAGEWYKRLATGGVLIAQLPPVLSPFLDRWKSHVNEVAPSLEVQTGTYAHYNTVRIQKHPGSPDELPLVPARVLMEERNSYRTFIIPKRDNK